MRIIAHRGASAEAPENTLAAFRRAIALGVEMIELDARLTRDGVAVVIHDPILSRTTDGEGRVAETGFAELGKRSAGAWFDPRFREERVPRLAEVFDLVQDRAEINVEIKAEPGRSDVPPEVPPELPPEVPSEARADFDHAARAEFDHASSAGSGHVETARAALRVAREADALGRSLFSCFDPAPLEALRREDEEIRLALLTGPSSLSGPYAFGSPGAGRKVLERMERWRDLAVEAACVHRTLMSRRLVGDLHARGWAIYVYTVDEEAAAERLDTMGVDGIFTNDPARLLRLWPARISRSND